MLLHGAYLKKRTYSETHHNMGEGLAERIDSARVAGAADVGLLEGIPLALVVLQVIRDLWRAPKSY